MQTISRTFILPEEAAGQRLDAAIARACPEFSRERLKAWIADASLQIDGRARRGKDKAKGGENIVLEATLEVIVESTPEPIALDIVFEDDDLLVINKPAGLVVHPAAGHHSGTLLNGLLHHCPALSELPRAGIVHRIDKETTGLLVIAKTLKAHTSLVDQLQTHSMAREYVAIAQGEIIAGDTIDAPLGRDPNHRQRMAIVEDGKPAVTHYRVAEKFLGFTLVNVQLETGRTHQIRVHFASIHRGLLGDQVYGARLRLPKGLSEEDRAVLIGFKRQALHARMLGLVHPSTQETVQWEVDLPEDMVRVLDVLRGA